MGPLEICANAINLLSVFLARKNSVHTWTLGIVGCALFAVLFYQVKLYADVTLQIFFIVTSLIGLWNWTRGRGKEKELPISRMNIWHFGGMLFLATAVTGAYGALLANWTDASLPFLDSLILVLSILAQFLLMGRKIENWLVWIAVNIVAVPVYASKELYLTSAIYAAFLGNAVWGYFHWRKLLRDQV